MKTFSATYKGNRLLELKVDVLLDEDTEVLVVVPEEEDTEESVWALLVTQEFAKGYGEIDSVYDTL
ncbi:MAG: hypothetical protein OXI91_11045 [Chloroflexota bacterium]|nr:hypothetical protein [Chloroflexota bacterium]